MRSLSGLNPRQTEAVRLVDRHLLVVAGAGSGKTRVLTHKIVYLVEECSVYPGGILAMTFSNKAADEMKARTRILLPSFEQPRWVGTFHSTCLRLLKEFCAEAGLTTSFTIYDESDQLSAVKRALSDLNFDPKQLPPKVIRYHIDRAKNETDQVVPHLEKQRILSDRGIEVARRYQQILSQNQALDFGDLLIRTVRLLRERPDVAQHLQQRWPRLLIDEYQDTNRIQKELVQALAGKTGIVCAVGDEDQSIYSWRGARVENMLEFPSDFPGADVVKLEQNYRSTKMILTAANHVIQNNAGRREKNLWTENEEGTAVTFFQAENDHGEAEFVLDRIQTLLRGDASPKEVAVFYRTHVQSRLVEEECRRRNVLYRVLGGTRFYDRAEIKDTLAFLKLMINPNDNVSFERIINEPARGIGKQSLVHLGELAATRQLSMLETIPYLEGRAKADKALHLFYQWFSELRSKTPDLTPAEIAEEILEKSGYLKALEQEGTIEAEARIENIEELLRSMNEFSEETSGTLTDYLDRISLYSDTDAYDPAAESIVLMTVHNSKGLEFNHVFIVGMEEGIFPHQRSLDEGGEDEVEEERRLCYVAMTRARKELTLTAAARRRLYHSAQFNPVSRFIGEIPAKYIVSLQDASPSADTSAFHPRKFTRRKSGAYDEFKQESYDEEAPARHLWGKAAQKAAAASPYSPGARVMHPDFGVGVIRQCEGNPDNLKLTIQFQQGGLKKILLNYCSLDLVER